MSLSKRDIEHAALTAQPGPKTLEVGAERYLQELQWCCEQGLQPEDCANLIAGAVYEAMVSYVIDRGLSDQDNDFNDGVFE